MEAVERVVVGYDIEDEVFLDRLLHRVEVEGIESAIGVPDAKFFECRLLGRGGECKVGGIVPQLPALHRLQDLVLVILGFLLAVAAERHVKLVGGLAALGRVGSVENDGEHLVAHVGDPIDDEWKLLDGRGDELFPRLEVGAQFGGAVRVGEQGFHLGEPPLPRLEYHGAIGVRRSEVSSSVRLLIGKTETPASSVPGLPGRRRKEFHGDFLFAKFAGNYPIPAQLLQYPLYGYMFDMWRIRIRKTGPRI